MQVIVIGARVDEGNYLPETFFERLNERRQLEDSFFKKYYVNEWNYEEKPMEQNKQKVIERNIEEVQLSGEQVEKIISDYLIKERRLNPDTTIVEMFPITNHLYISIETEEEVQE